MTAAKAFALNRELVAAYIHAFRAAAAEFGLAAEPDLNVILRMPGALDASITARPKANSRPSCWRSSTRRSTR